MRTVIGKNYSCNNLGQRRKSDDYETPYSMTEQLLHTGQVDRGYDILEPASGGGAIVTVLKRNGYNVDSYDLRVGKDFLDEQRHYDCVFTNPPYSLANDFILKSKQIARHKIVLLLPLSYLHSKRRFDTIWTDIKFPLRHVYVFTRYPLLGEALRATANTTPA